MAKKMKTILVTYHKSFIGNYLHDFYVNRRLIDTIKGNYNIISYSKLVLLRQNLFFIFLKICEKLFGIHSSLTIFFHKKFKIIPRIYFKNLNFDYAIGQGYAVEKSPDNKYCSYIFTSFKHQYNKQSKDLKNLINFKSYYYSKVDKIIVFSEAYKNEIMKNFKIDTSIISVIPPLIPNSITNLDYNSNKILQKKIELLSNGIIEILFVGKDGRRKGADLIDKLATKILDNKKFKVNINCVTDYNFNEKKINVYKDISSEDLKKLYERAHIFLFPTKFDTFGVVILEAMSNYCSIITSDTVPQNEIINYGECGLLLNSISYTSILKKINFYFENTSILIDHMKKSNFLFNKKYTNIIAKNKLLKLL